MHRPRLRHRQPSDRACLTHSRRATRRTKAKRPHRHRTPQSRRHTQSAHAAERSHTFGREQRIGAISELVVLHLAAVRKAAAFAFYERLFGLWHVLHLPLFFILVLATAIHVVAAHLF